MTQDLDSWMAEKINAAIPEGRWNPTKVAGELVTQLTEQEPERFNQWMKANAIRHVRQTINDRHRAERARITRQRKAAMFHTAATEATTGGNTETLDPYLVPYSVDDARGDRMRLGDMTGNDCQQAAAEFESRIRENEMQAALLEAVARRVGVRKVRDVLSRDQLLNMFKSVGLEFQEEEAA